MKDEFDWIRDTIPSLFNKVIKFEPILDPNEFDTVLNKFIDHMNSYGETIVWGSGRPVKDYFPEVYVHHLIIKNNGSMYFGGITVDEYHDLISDGFRDEEIRTDYGNLNLDIEDFVNIDFYDELDGREYFNIPYVGNISENFLQDFDDIEIYPTLGDIWSEKLLSVGDVLILSSMVMPAHFRLLGDVINNFKVVINHVDFEYFESCVFTILDAEDMEKLVDTMKVNRLVDLNFIEEDKNLNVIKITKK